MRDCKRLKEDGTDALYAGPHHGPLYSRGSVIRNVPIQDGWIKQFFSMALICDVGRHAILCWQGCIVGLPASLGNGQYISKPRSGRLRGFLVQSSTRQLTRLPYHHFTITATNFISSSPIAVQGNTLTRCETHTDGIVQIASVSDRWALRLLFRYVSGQETGPDIAFASPYLDTDSKMGDRRSGLRCRLSLTSKPR